MHPFAKKTGNILECQVQARLSTIETQTRKIATKQQAQRKLYGACYCNHQRHGKRTFKTWRQIFPFSAQTAPLFSSGCIFCWIQQWANCIIRIVEAFFYEFLQTEAWELHENSWQSVRCSDETISSSVDDLNLDQFPEQCIGVCGSAVLLRKVIPAILTIKIVYLWFRPIKIITFPLVN